MAFTNMGGASDTDLTNSFTQPDAGALPPEATEGALGEPGDEIEVVEIETYEPTPAGYGADMGEAMGTANQPGFRWWMVPAAAVPVAAGATAAVLLLRRRRRQSAPVAAYNKLAKQSRDWMRTVRKSQATKSANKALSQGVESVRGAAKSLPGVASGWRVGAAELVAAVTASTAAKRPAGGVRGLLDSVTGIWNTNALRVRQAFKARGRRGSARALAGRAAVRDWLNMRNAQAARFRARAGKATGRADKLTAAAKPMAAAATAKATKAARQTNRAAKRAGRRASNAAKRTRAFTFGMLVAATATYWRAWQRRLREKETRETAGGRMVKA